MDIRKAIAEQIGGLTIQVFELTAEVQRLSADNAQLKAAQSQGKTQANEMLDAQHSLNGSAEPRNDITRAVS